MDWHVWLAYFVASWVIAVSPGSGAVLAMSHGLAYGVRGDLDPAVVQKIKAAFLALDPAKPEHKAILELQRASRFIATEPRNYDGIEDAAKTAGLLK